MDRGVAPLQPLAQRFVDALAAQPGPPLEQLPPEVARAVVVGVQSSPPFVPAAEVSERRIAGVSTWIYRPPGSTGTLPGVVYFHGGGWVLCDHATHDRFMRELAVGAGCAVVFVEFSRSPEAAFPTALDEACAVVTELAIRGAEFGIDGSRLAVAGDSAGANLATVAAMRFATQDGPRLRFQLLFFPVADAAMDTPSYREFAEGFFLTRAQMEAFFDAYLPDRARRFDAAVSPLRARTADLAGEPPALIITADHDVLRDEGEAYGRKLAEAGVPVTVERYPGTIHAFVVLNAFTEDPSPRRAIAQAADALRRALAPS